MGSHLNSSLSAPHLEREREGEKRQRKNILLLTSGPARGCPLAFPLPQGICTTIGHFLLIDSLPSASPLIPASQILPAIHRFPADSRCPIFSSQWPFPPSSPQRPPFSHLPPAKPSAFILSPDLPSLFTQTPLFLSDHFCTQPHPTDLFSCSPRKTLML